MPNNPFCEPEDGLPELPPMDYYLLRWVVEEGKPVTDEREGFQQRSVRHPHYERALDPDRVRRLVRRGLLEPDRPTSDATKLDLIRFHATPAGRAAVELEITRRREARERFARERLDRLEQINVRRAEIGLPAIERG
jgi:hypothetical protein